MQAGGDCQQQRSRTVDITQIMSELRQLQALARTTNRPIEYRKASPKQLPVAADKYLYGLFVALMAGTCFGAGWAAWGKPTPLNVGVTVGALLGTLASLAVAYMSHERRWQVEVYIDAPEAEQLVRPEFHDARSIQRPNVQLPPEWVDKLRELVRDENRISGRRLHEFDLIGDRGNRAQVAEAFDRLRAMRWLDGDRINDVGLRALGGLDD